MSQPVQCEVITWSRFHAMARALAGQIRQSDFRPDIIVAIGRGGYMPARILSDFLDLMDLATFKIEHYHGARKGLTAGVRYPLTADLTGRRVLLVDDVSDSGDTFETALEHLKSRGEPAEVRTAVLHHKTVSRYTPDYYVQRIVKWRWIIYPWAIAEDLASFIRAMHPRPAAVTDVARRLKVEHGIEVPESVLRDVLAMVDDRAE